MKNRIHNLSIVIAILLFSQSLMAQQYEIKSKPDLKKKITASNLQEFFPREDNDSFVYRLKDGHVILLPAVGSQGVLFKSYSEYETRLKDGIIPIVNTDNFFETHQSLVKQIPEQSQLFLQRLEDSLSFKLVLGDLSKAYIDSLESHIDQYGRNKALKNLYLELGVYLGELVRRKVYGTWRLETEYGINRYYLPKVFTATHKFLPWYELNAFFGKEKRYPLDMVIRGLFHGFEL